MANFFDCKAIADSIIENVAKQVKILDRPPFLVGIRLEGVPGSEAYANGIKKDCNRCGILYSEHIMDFEAPIESWDKRIAILNEDDAIDGIIVFTPCPMITQKINPEKDVDATDSNLYYDPCTPSAVIKILLQSTIKISEKHAVVIGRSNTVGKPMARLFLDNDATVTVCHSKTQNLAKYCRDADIIVAATGQKNLVTYDMVRVGTTVIDVSRADVKFDEVSRVAEFMTPQKNGLGLVTRAVLMEHVLEARRSKISFLNNEVQNN